MADAASADSPSVREVASAVQGAAPSAPGAAELAAPQSVLVQNGVAKVCQMSAADLLRSYPRGAYTTARTVGVHSVLEFDMHVQRLVESAGLMGLAVVPGGATGESSGDQEKGRDSCRDSPDAPAPPMHTASASASAAAAAESQLTFEPYDLFVHAAPLPPPPSPPVRVVVAGRPRKNAAAKDSAWVRERAALEEVKKQQGAEEVLLVDSDGSVLEGGTSNFFAVEAGGVVVTAEEGVLKGTIRSLILSVCQQQGVPVQLRAPQIAEAHTWQGAFISSTSRLLLPLDTILLPSPQHHQQQEDSAVEATPSQNAAESTRPSDPPRAFTPLHMSSDFVRQLQQHVSLAIAAHCTCVLEEV
ncbi:unnamed protein product [Closterium sp. Yama58-4]|nr:unnamed protein product [Closterium sp. Yama58-4]